MSSWDLIDYQSQPDGEYKFIMVYQDHLTKFIILNSLKRKTDEEVPTQEISLRAVATGQSTGSGQGFFKCFCKKNCVCVKQKV